MFWHPPQGARRRAVRWRHPSSWSRCRSGEVPDRSARCLKKRGFARHVPSPCFTEIDLHEKSGGVPDTDPHPRKKRRIKEQRSKATVRAPRRSCDRCCNPWVSCLLLPPPIQQPTRPRYPQRYTEGETLLREYLGPSTATKDDSKCCVETITATLSAVYWSLSGSSSVTAFEKTIQAPRRDVAVEPSDRCGAVLLISLLVQTR